MSGIPPEQVHLSSLEIQRTDEVFDPVVETPFQATAHVHVDCRPDAVETAVVEVTDAGAELTKVTFGLAPEGRRQLEHDALADAMAHARAKAERLAAAEDATVGTVCAIETADGETGMESIVDDSSYSSSISALSEPPKMMSLTLIQPS
jgi:uncharacterized protein YggE